LTGFVKMTTDYTVTKGAFKDIGLFFGFN